METKEWDVLSEEEQMIVTGGYWIIIDGEWIWMETDDFDKLKTL